MTHHRPPSPNKGRGRIQIQVKRAFVAAGGDTLSSSEVFDWVFARARRVSWRRRQRWSVVRVLRQIADPVGRAGTRGRPWLWRLKPDRAQAESH
jgi:hypothetical protein